MVHISHSSTRSNIARRFAQEDFFDCGLRIMYSAPLSKMHTRRKCFVPSSSRTAVQCSRDQVEKMPLSRGMSRVDPLSCPSCQSIFCWFSPPLLSCSVHSPLPHSGIVLLCGWVRVHLTFVSTLEREVLICLNINTPFACRQSL